MLIFFYFLLACDFFEINYVSAAPDNTVLEKDKCVYLRGRDFVIEDYNNPLIEGLDRKNDSWYRQVNWSQHPRDYIKVKYVIWRMNTEWDLVADDEVFLCASKPGTVAGDLAKLIREALGIGERCPIKLGINKTDPTLFDGKKCRIMKLRTKLGPDTNGMFVKVKSDGLPDYLMNGFIQLSLQPL